MSQRARRIYCNRTLNFRSIRAIGYDMDYTLIHYHVDAWEGHAYEHVKQRLLREGWPIDGLEFDPSMMIRGLVIDAQLGNVLKANRFGFVKRAQHGTAPIPFEEMRHIYQREIVDLSDSRWCFMNTLFSMSEACLYAQLVAMLDAGELDRRLSYGDLYKATRDAFDGIHSAGELKADIMNAPERFVDLDPSTALALLDQKHAKKKLALITNSEWEYTAVLMKYAYDRYLPGDMTWRDLFDVVVVSARKPDFFTRGNPVFEVVDDDGLLRPAESIESGRAYVGGDADKVESCLGLHGDQILFVGDHIFSDVNVSKKIQRWRTALILRELEPEVAAADAFREQRIELEGLMREKEALELAHCKMRIAELRVDVGYGPEESRTRDELRAENQRIKIELEALDVRIKPLAAAASDLVGERWGPMMRAGNDKSHLARQVERYADVYLARVSDFLHETPFAYLRSVRGTLPHD